MDKKQWKARLREICRQIGAMSDEQRATVAACMPITTCEGHPLSLYNQCFLALQAQATLTIVGGFRQWKKVGRHVRAGEHAAGYIYVPIGPKSTDDPDESEDRPEDRPEDETSVRFTLVPMFDIAQTESTTAVESEHAEAA